MSIDGSHNNAIATAPVSGGLTAVPVYATTSRVYVANGLAYAVSVLQE